MIIKTKGQEGSWRFYDGAREVQYHTCHHSDVPTVEVLTKEENCGVGFEENGITYENFLSFADGPSTHVLCIAFHDHEGKARELYVNRETYLLNDSGKTIERLF